MRKFLFTSLFITLWVLVYSQNKEAYTTKYNIHYYSDSINQADEYINERCVLDVYYPTNRENFCTIVWFHGGGLTTGNKEIPVALKDKGLCVIGVNYRLSPKVKAPKYIDDAAAAVAWAFNNIHRFGGDPELIFISGHSAGGYLASMIGLDKKWLSRYAIDANQIAGLIPFSGHTITHFTVRKERGIKGTQPVIDELAPLFHVRSDAPPLLLISGDRELEILGRYEENAYLMRMMKVVGHRETKLFELDGFDHGGMVGPAFSLLIKEIQRIIEESQNNNDRK